MIPSPAPVGEPDRLHVLDVLRGIALVGMFFVHFSMFSSGGTAVDRAYQSAVALLFEERFWAMFAMLFGVGFAIQLRRAEARGTSIVPSFVRRLAALAVFGFVAHAFFGFNVLLGYAAWGLPLLLVRRWSVRALIVAAVVSANSWNVYMIAEAARRVAARGEQAVRAELQSKAASNRAFTKANQEAQESTHYSAVVTARLQHMRWFYAQPFSFLPVNTFTLFLLGLIGMRLGLFDEPERHRRLIATLMIFGAASWATATWVFPLLPAHTQEPLVRAVALSRLQYGLGLIREMWLAFTYMGAVLILVASNRQWLPRLGMFAWTGRMALTNYMIQIAILDLTFSKYALGLSVTPLVGLAMAVTLFSADAMFSRWWLARHRYGPLEWLWRSVTYTRWQPWRIAASAEKSAATSEGLTAVG
jgi:uncharacterized protein